MFVSHSLAPVRQHYVVCRFRSVERTVEQTLLACTIACNVLVISACLLTTCCPLLMCYPTRRCTRFPLIQSADNKLGTESLQQRRQNAMHGAPMELFNTLQPMRAALIFSSPRPPRVNKQRKKTQLDTKYPTENCGQVGAGTAILCLCFFRRA